MKPRIAIVRGKFLNRYEMQFFEPLVKEFDITAFGSLSPYHDRFDFPVVKLPSPMDLPDFPFKIPVLNRLFVDAHYLYGLEARLKGFDIVHSAETYFRYTQQSLNAKKMGNVKKVIATVLENIPHNNEGIRGRKAYKKRAIRELDHIIALTELTKKTLLIEGADPAKITVIKHYVNTKRFTPGKPHKGRDVVRILFSGRLEEYKGVFDIVHALSVLRKLPAMRGKKYTLRIVGEGSMKERLIRLEEKLGLTNIVRHTSVSYENMPDIYRHADIFIAPSKPTKTWTEQYNTALLEAQASGLAIITTSTGGIPENIGNAGIIVKPGDIGALASKLALLIGEPKIRLDYARKARLRALQNHDITFGARKLSALYSSLL